MSDAALSSLTVGVVWWCRKEQETEPNAECLPTLRASDINPVDERVDVKQYNIGYFSLRERRFGRRN